MILQKSGALAGFMSDIAIAPGWDVGGFVAVKRLDLGVNDLIPCPRRAEFGASL